MVILELVLRKLLFLLLGGLLHVRIDLLVNSVQSIEISVCIKRAQNINPKIHYVAADVNFCRLYAIVTEDIHFWMLNKGNTVIPMVMIPTHLVCSYQRTPCSFKNM